jgi:hypothetical protein
MMRQSKSNIGMPELQSPNLNKDTNPVGLTPASGGYFWHPGGGNADARPASPWGVAREGLVAASQRVTLPRGRPRQATLANLGRIVFESVPEIYDVNRASAFWFYFYGLPQPLAEGLS